MGDCLTCKLTTIPLRSEKATESTLAFKGVSVDVWLRGIYSLDAPGTSGAKFREINIGDPFCTSQGYIHFLMAQPAACTSPRHGVVAEGPLGRGTPPRANLLLSIINNKEHFFKNFEEVNRAEVDIRPRFQRLRAIRASYVVHLVKGVERAWDDLQNDVESGNVHITDEVVQRFDSLMLHIDEALSWDSKNRQDDTQAAQAPVVDQYFMDKVLRRYMHENTHLCAPNAEPNIYYGKIGESISAEFSALRGSTSDPIRRFILDKITVPFNHRIYWPLAKLFAWLLGRNQPTGESRVSQRTLDIIVSTLEMLIAAVCIAGSVALLYSLESTKARIITAFFESIICAIPAAFLSELMKTVSILIAGIWAVLTVIVFLSDQKVGSKSG